MRQLSFRLFSCFVLFAAVSLCAADEDHFSFDSFGDDSVIEFGDDIPDIDPSQMQLRVASDVVANQVLSNIKEPLWKSTIAPVGRDILYLLPQKITAIEYGGISAKFFFNMTNRMKMSVDDMLALPDITQQNIKDLIETLIPDTSPEIFEQLIPLFQKITLQERKAGVMLQGGFIKGPFVVQAATSLQVGERNFWLSKYDQERVTALFSNEAPDADQKELYKIACGFGDTRIKLGLNTLNMTSFQNDFGFSCILPTSRLTQSDKVNLGLVQAVFDAKGPEALKTEAIRSLKAIRDYLLHPRFGNNGHFAIGCYAEQKIGLFHDFMQLWIGASYDLFVANEEERPYMFKPVLKPSDMANIVGNPADPVVTASNNKKVTDYIRQYILPSSFKVTVLPGDVTNFVTALTVDWNKRWRSTWGYDFYAQRKTLIQAIHDTTVSLNDLRIDDDFTTSAESVYAYQHKVFSETLYRKKTARYDFGIGVGSDMTISSKRIGEDWTVYLKFAATF